MQQNSADIEVFGELAEQAYDNTKTVSDSPDGLSQYTILQTQDTVTATSGNNAGFQAMLLQDTQTGEYVIAFRGTELSFNPFNITETWKDGVYTDVLMAIGDDMVAQMELALQFIEELSATYTFNQSNTTFTGHSLGGSLASIAGYTYGFDTYTYNGFGVRDILEGADYNDFVSTNNITSLSEETRTTNILHVGGEYIDDKATSLL